MKRIIVAGLLGSLVLVVRLFVVNGLFGFNKFGIGGYPLGDAVLLRVHDIVLWTLAGTVIA